MSQNGQGGKGAKRQRKKEGRRARIEQELKAQQARRRKRLAINLGLVLALGAIAFFFFGREEKPERTKPVAAGECSHSKPAGGNTDTGDSPPAMSIDKAKSYTAVIETSCGTVEAELAVATSPNTVNSFVSLAKQGFYDGLPFHRIVKDFAIQGGDPKGDGTGGPKYKTVDPVPGDFKYVKGTLAMAKGGAEPAGTAGSQFFIVPADSAQLTPDYAVLGKVTKGDDVVAKLNNVKTESAPGGGEKSKPVEPVYIKKITIKEGQPAAPPANT